MRTGDDLQADIYGYAQFLICSERERSARKQSPLDFGTYKLLGLKMTDMLY